MISIILFILITALAGMCKAAADTIQHHYWESIFSKYDPRFWNAEISWKNKYKDGNPALGRKYWKGFDGFTDAWHIATNSVAGLLLLLPLLPAPGFNIIIVYVVLWTVFIQSFNLFYNHIFKLKK